jgi:hypothetical protein
LASKQTLAPAIGQRFPFVAAAEPSRALPLWPARDPVQKQRSGANRPTGRLGLSDSSGEGLDCWDAYGSAVSDELLPIRYMISSAGKSPLRR